MLVTEIQDQWRQKMFVELMIENWNDCMGDEVGWNEVIDSEWTDGEEQVCARIWNDWWRTMEVMIKWWEMSVIEIARLALMKKMEVIIMVIVDCVESEFKC